MRRQGSQQARGPRVETALQQPLEALFDPSSIAVVGASDDPAKWGHILARRALESSGDRPVVLVNRSNGQVLGRPTYPSLAVARAAGEQVDLVVLCVPSAGLVEAVRDAVDAGARSLVVITAGLSEHGETGAAVEREALGIAQEAGVVLVGPNCLGVVDTGTSLQLSHAVLPPGDVTVLSQSGNVVLDLAALLEDRRLGVARFVSVGNQADVSVVDLMQSCLTHEGTRAVAMYAEDVVDGRAFVAAARALVDAGKPVVLLAPGRSEAAVRGARSHTGALTSASQVVDAACAAAGIHRVDNPTQMADLLAALLADRRLRGARVAVVTDGGGHGAIAADTLADVGLETLELDDAVRADLRAALGEGATVTNPVDLAGAGDLDPLAYARGVTTLLAADDVDAVLLTGYFGGYSTGTTNLTEPELEAARMIGAAAVEWAKPVVVQTIFPDSPSSRVLLDAAIPVHRDIDRACDVLAALVVRETPETRALPTTESPPLRHVVRRRAGAARRGRGRVRAVPHRALAGRAAGGTRRPGADPATGAEGGRQPAQVRRRGSRARPGRRSGGRGGLRRPGRPARAAGGLGRGDGRPRRRGRADRGLPARPAVRSGADGRARRCLRRGARRHGGRARARQR